MALVDFFDQLGRVVVDATLQNTEDHPGAVHAARAVDQDVSTRFGAGLTEYLRINQFSYGRLGGLEIFLIIIGFCDQFAPGSFRFSLVPASGPGFFATLFS